MSSTNKTNLGFNKWVLSDKPTMQDFNADNSLMDELLRSKADAAQLEAEITQLRQGQIKEMHGSWTPAFAGSEVGGNNTYGDQWGKFTRIGSLVKAAGRIYLTARDSAMSGRVQVIGLPFTAAYSYEAAAVSYASGALGAPQGTITIGLHTDGAYKSMSVLRSGFGVANVLDSSELVPNILTFTITYTTSDPWPES